MVWPPEPYFEYNKHILMFTDSDPFPGTLFPRKASQEMIATIFPVCPKHRVGLPVFPVSQIMLKTSDFEDCQDPT